MTNLDSILKSRDITLSTNVCLVKAMVFPVVVYGCESWTIKKAGHEKTDAFELWCWRRLLRVPWTARISNQSIWKEISPEYSLEGLTLKPKLQYFGQLMQRTDSLEKTLMLGTIEGRRRGWQRMRCVDVNKLWQILKDMGIPGDLICLLRNLYADQKATVRTGHGTTNWFNIEKRRQQDCILSPCLFNFYAEYIMWNTGWMNHSWIQDVWEKYQ